ncbi:MAG: shikimate dehydrogenase, partial [Leptolyngbyaceae cyanobacterium CSU_1_3]|nr:shikimate dehydrogenase [Leptolyngbyaceae cyanobacterium CSU_1_3]
MRSITGQTNLLGVMGDPIEHSLSPVMHNAALAALGSNFVYVPFLVAPTDLPCALDGLAAIGVRGFSVTIPHKQAILPLLSEISDVAQAIGAVNTVWRTEQGWSGTNTDAEGFLAPLRSMPQNWHGAVAVILGNGGAARAVVAGCAQLGFAEIHVIGRNPHRLDEFWQSWQSSPWAKAVSVHPWDDIAPWIARADLLVNSTPIGMAPYADRSPLTAAETEQISPHTVAYDLIYTPNPTVFLQQIRERGGVAIDGLEMLVQQGAAALQI